MILFNVHILRYQIKKYLNDFNNFLIVLVLAVNCNERENLSRAISAYVENAFGNELF